MSSLAPPTLSSKPLILLADAPEIPGVLPKILWSVTMAWWKSVGGARR